MWCSARPSGPKAVSFLPTRGRGQGDGIRHGGVGTDSARDCAADVPRGWAADSRRPSPAIGLEGQPLSIYKNFVKPTGDWIAAVLALIVLAPLFAIVGWLIHREDKGPIFFRQSRPGKDDVLFELIKFRSMPVGTPQVPSADAADLPLTKIGRAIRRWNLDEVPQLLNIARGEMSLVGPRPAMPSQHCLLELRRQNGASRLRPGLTGLAQVNGTDGMSEEEKATWDGKYAATVSLRQDLSVLALTVKYLAKPPPRV
jgi:O-antigen biosynthesis protein WbqP